METVCVSSFVSEYWLLTAWDQRQEDEKEGNVRSDRCDAVNGGEQRHGNKEESEGRVKHLDACQVCCNIIRVKAICAIGVV